MKKKSWIKYAVSLAVGIGFVLMYVWGYYIAQKWDARLTFKYENAAVDADLTETVVKNGAKYKLIAYDEKTKKYTNEERNIPSEFVGLTRDELISYVENNNDFFAKEDEILSNVMLVSFSEKKVIIRKSIKEHIVAEKETTNEKMPRYYIMIIDSRVVVYKSDLKTIYMETGILESELDYEVAVELRNGRAVFEISELYRILESLTS